MRAVLFSLSRSSPESVVLEECHVVSKEFVHLCTSYRDWQMCMAKRKDCTFLPKATMLGGGSDVAILFDRFILWPNYDIFSICETNERATKDDEENYNDDVKNKRIGVHCKRLAQ